MSLGQICEIQSSYELYKEIAEDLCVPVDFKLPVDVRYQLYLSKMVYLRNLFDQCFKSINHFQNKEQFSANDFEMIRSAIEATQEFLRQTCLQAMDESLERLQRKDVI